jgi:hypothetical protein
VRGNKKNLKERDEIKLNLEGGSLKPVELGGGVFIDNDQVGQTFGGGWVNSSSAATVMPPLSARGRKPATSPTD